MWTFKRTFQEAFNRGGILFLGLGCLFLFRQQYYPNVLGPLSFGIISVGAFGLLRHQIKDLSSSIEDSQYQEILSLIEQRQSEIEANRCMLEELRNSCSRFMAMREILEAWERDPSHTGYRVIDEILTRYEAASVKSFQDTTCEVQMDLLTEKNHRTSENRALKEENEMKFEVQQEQTGRNFETLKDQVSQIQTNISATLQCHDNEKSQQEETKNQYLIIVGEESKQEVTEITCEKAIETDENKQEDKDFKDLGKSEDGGVECKHEETENMSESNAKPDDNEVFQKKESAELNPLGERSEDITFKEIQTA